MRRALAEYVVEGIKTNIPFHLRMLRDPDFLSGDFDTRFVDDRFLPREHQRPPAHPERALIAAAVLAYWKDEEAALRSVSCENRDGPSAWSRAGRAAGVARWPSSP
jgi:acetyl-CoA carboxylase, biotin carboxylase subunit